MQSSEHDINDKCYGIKKHNKIRPKYYGSRHNTYTISALKTKRYSYLFRQIHENSQPNQSNKIASQISPIKSTRTCCHSHARNNLKSKNAYLSYQPKGKMLEDINYGKTCCASSGERKHANLSCKCHRTRGRLICIIKYPCGYVRTIHERSQ